eukprot:CAMPEP_0184280476 /NCGR_PEP_ID=MMETSP0977-20130417/58708_1 /TAXON_ID=483370 /ORGANISM="non described non described, Strain CCMP2097" /LENGTH=188 /DNA_ID=CAMNT_0026586449 /DNA_START=134 /DNA_END=697 /DNA_ORIENTATION=-
MSHDDARSGAAHRRGAAAEALARRPAARWRGCGPTVVSSSRLCAAPPAPPWRASKAQLFCVVRGGDWGLARQSDGANKLRQLTEVSARDVDVIRRFVRAALPRICDASLKVGHCLERPRGERPPPRLCELAPGCAAPDVEPELAPDLVALERPKVVTLFSSALVADGEALGVARRDARLLRHRHRVPV